ncbi:MAG TPA: parallel beta-helix domain-containing protein [Myxococcaceae bacterium]|nr:parallel beta-helix domain-containing protein [Myxococcaceae bacterium]
MAVPCTAFPVGTSEQTISAAFAQAAPGATLVFDSGTYAFTNSLNLAAVAGVTVRGQGADKTILDFKGQAAGADGILADRTNRVAFRDFWVRDPISSGVRVNHADGVTMHGLKVSWTTPDISKHGAYGLYPVLSHDVVLEDSAVSGASDSGICASQLDHAIVRRNDLSGNVAGIIVRNPYLLDLMDNRVHQNSVGIIVGTLPGDEQLNGHDIRIAGNQIVDNNVPGLDRPDATVDRVPSGTGLVVAGNHRVEISGNTISNHGTNGIAVVSLLFAGIPLDPGIDPFPTAIHVHDNTLSGIGASPDMTKALGQLLASGAAAWDACCGGHLPDILVDGIVSPFVSPGANPMGWCVKPGTSTFANLHADRLDPEMDNLGAIAETTASAFDCASPVLPPVVVPGA